MKVAKIKRWLAAHGIGNPLNQLIYDDDEVKQFRKHHVYKRIERRGRPKNEKFQYGIAVGYGKNKIVINKTFRTYDEATDFGFMNYKVARGWEVVSL